MAEQAFGVVLLDESKALFAVPVGFLASGVVAEAQGAVLAELQLLQLLAGGVVPMLFDAVAVEAGAPAIVVVGRFERSPVVFLLHNAAKLIALKFNQAVGVLGLQQVAGGIVLVGGLAGFAVFRDDRFLD